MYTSALAFLYAEGVSTLKAAADTCKAATAFARHDVANAVTEWWTQPAVNAVPWVKCKSRCHMQLTTSGSTSINADQIMHGSVKHGKSLNDMLLHQNRAILLWLIYCGGYTTVIHQSHPNNSYMMQMRAEMLENG